MRLKIKTLTIRIVTLTGILVASESAMAACLKSLTTDSSMNTGVGSSVLCNNTGVYNTGVGEFSLYSNTTGENNTATGSNAISANTTGKYNTGFGSSTLFSNTTGESNTAIGAASLLMNVIGNYNTATGAGALSKVTGSNNTAIGYQAGSNQTTGSRNLTLGYQAGKNLTTGSNNIMIGAQGAAEESTTIRIGVQNTQTRTIIAGIYGTDISGTAVMVNSSGRLGVTSSSRRYKEDIQPMGDVSDRLMNLRPVTFHYKRANDQGNKPIQYGLIAEEVDTAMPELVVRNADGSPETVAYHILPSLLLNEYQKQHRELAETKEKLATLEAEMSHMRDSVDRLMATLPTTTKLASAE